MEINYLKLTLIISIVVVSSILVKLVRIFLIRFFGQASKYLKVDPTRYKFFSNAISLLIYLIALTLIVYSIPSLKTLAVGMVAGASIFAAIIGFASQQAFSNMISGIFIVIFKPFRVDDLIKVGDRYFGIVEDITLRHTIIRDFENKRIIIPNAMISSETVINSSIQDQKIRRHVEIGISYDSDIDKAIKIIQEEALNHPYCFDNRTKKEREKGEPEIVVRVIGFGDSSVNLKAYVWADDPIKAFEMNCDLNKSIKSRFDREGIEIPFPYRTIVYKKDITPTTDNRDP